MHHIPAVVPPESKIQSFEDLLDERVATGRGSIGYQLILAARAIGKAAGLYRAAPFSNVISEE
jgi:TRAP-type uncharacterized transport system substrate-binding protein